MPQMCSFETLAVYAGVRGACAHAADAASAFGKFMGRSKFDEGGMIGALARRFRSGCA
jgi:hypothetical protein